MDAEWCDAQTPDEVLLAGLDDKLQLVRDRVQGVAEKYATGLYLWGEGGTSKSYTVEQHLQILEVPYKLTNSRVTGLGLYHLLHEAPDIVHVLEDAETLFSDPSAFGVLRSALWGQTGPSGRAERTVSWSTGVLRDGFVFTGGVIVTANCPLADLPQARALKTRIAVVQFAPTNAEVAALMRRIASRGHAHGRHELAPEACLEVAAAIVDRSARLQRNLDLRLLVNACNDRLQYENGASETHWLHLLESRMEERVLPPPCGTGVRAATRDKELALLRQIGGLAPQARFEAWARATKKSRAALYRRLGELNDLDRTGSQLSQLSRPAEPAEPSAPPAATG